MWLIRKINKIKVFFYIQGLINVRYLMVLFFLWRRDEQLCSSDGRTQCLKKKKKTTAKNLTIQLYYWGAEPVKVALENGYKVLVQNQC